MNGNSIGIVIPVHNRVRQTVKCLERVVQSSFGDFSVYIVDDGSTDDTPAVLADRFPEAKVIQGDGNLWWAKAANLGIRAALDEGVQYVLLLNNDNLISKETLEELLRVSQLKGDAIVGSVVVYEDQGQEKVKHANLYNGVDRGTKARNPYYNRSIAEVPEIIPTEILSGQGSLIPRWVFNCVGSIDENSFPHYMGDFDFFMRCSRKNLPMFVAGKAIVEDDVSTTGIHMSSRRIPTFDDFLRSLFVINSHRNIRANVRYFRRYCKSGMTFLYGLTFFYCSYLVSFLLARIGMVRLRQFLIRKFS